MNNFDDPLENMRRQSGGAKKKKRPYEDPLKRVNPGQAAKASGKSNLTAGQYVRRQFTFKPGQLEMIAEVAEQLDLSQNAAARWLFDVGLRAYVNGERPEIETVQVRNEPVLEDW